VNAEVQPIPQPWSNSLSYMWTTSASDVQLRTTLQNACLKSGFPLPRRSSPFPACRQDDPQRGKAAPFPLPGAGAHTRGNPGHGRAQTERVVCLTKALPAMTAQANAYRLPDQGVTASRPYKGAGGMKRNSTLTRHFSRRGSGYPLTSSTASPRAAPE